MAMREYRKGNWTVEETMILIEAKKKDDERRRLYRSKQTLQTLTVTTTTTTTTTATSGSSSSTSKPVTELRWRWVEEYCWGKGCYRSQNQCNDKWDNLMRDYKKVRDYQRNLGVKISQQETTMTNNKSYWDMDKVERKDKGLPTNMLPQIYQALFDVVESSGTTSTTPSPSPSLQLSPAPAPAQLPMLHSPRLPSPSLPPFITPQLHSSPALIEGETSEQHSLDPELSTAKRRRKEGGGGGSGGEATQTPVATAAEVTATTTATGTGTSAGSLEEVSTAICRSATLISEAIQASDEKQERRHREMTRLHESRLRIEESSLEFNRQGLNGLTDAINRLATSIFTWANSHKTQQGP